MKTKTHIFACILFTCFVLIFTVSCTKEPSKETTNRHPTLSAEDLKLSRMIESFIIKGKSNLKEGEEITVDSAIWYLEATSNYTYGDGSVETIETTSDSAFITLEIVNSKIFVNEVYAKYQVMIDSIRAYYQSISESDKQLMAVNVEMKTITATQLTCKITSTFAKGYFPGLDCYFNDIDGWEPVGAWWNNGGICSGPNFGMYTNRDLVTEIQRKIMICKPVLVGNYYYDPVIDVELYGRDFPDPDYTGNNLNIRSHFIYWNSEDYPNYLDCVPPGDCNYYLSGTNYVLTQTAVNGGARPEGYSFISLYGFEGIIWTSIPGITEHHGFAQYGVLHVCPNPPLPM